jgi:hypothetical protein
MIFETYHAPKDLPPVKSVTSAGLLVLSLLIFSFAYELPLVNLTRYDRLNPRLFDVAACVLVVYWLFAGSRRGWRIRLRLPVVWPWFWLTVFFGIATVGSFFFIPFETYLFSIFYFLKYIEVLIVVLIFASIPMTSEVKRKLLWVAMWGGSGLPFTPCCSMPDWYQPIVCFPRAKRLACLSRGSIRPLGLHTTILGCSGFYRV